MAIRFPSRSGGVHAEDLRCTDTQRRVNWEVGSVDGRLRARHDGQRTHMSGPYGWVGGLRVARNLKTRCRRIKRAGEQFCIGAFFLGVLFPERANVPDNTLTRASRAVITVNCE
nr:hypothetical protein Iba_chr01dCG12230 [Ipomoea batatas]